MANLYLIIFIVSFIFQSIYSRIRYKYILNPIFIFNIIFFLHNWSLSFVQIIEPDTRQVIPNNSPELYKEQILLINIMCLWAFFIGINLFNTTSVKKKWKQIKYNLSIYNTLYYAFAIFSFIYGIATNQYTKNYGVDQAQNATVAFNPMGIVSTFRYVIGIIVILSNYNNNKAKKIFIIELFFSIITGGRKNIVSIIIAFLLSKYEFKKINLKIKHIIISILAFITIGYFTMFITEFRIIKKDLNISFSERVALANMSLKERGNNVFLSFLYSANSEGVQAWTLSLLENKSLTKTNGLSYVQAIVNTVILRPFQGKLVNYQAAFYFKQVAYPNIVNHGWDYSFSAEAILNWGNFAFVSYLLLGLFIGWLFKKRQIDQYYNFLYQITLSTLFINLRTDSTSLFRILSIYIITFFFLRLFNLVKKYIYFT